MSRNWLYELQVKEIFGTGNNKRIFLSILIDSKGFYEHIIADYLFFSAIEKSVNIWGRNI